MSKRLDSARALALSAHRHDNAWTGERMREHLTRVQMAAPNGEDFIIAALLHHLTRETVQVSDLDLRFGPKAAAAIWRLTSRPEQTEAAYWHAMGNTDDEIARTIAKRCLDDCLEREHQQPLDAGGPTMSMVFHLTTMRDVYTAGFRARLVDAS